MTRREFIGLLSAVLIIRPEDGAAQSSARTYRLASLTGNVSLSTNTPDAKALLNAMAERGYTLGKNLAYDARGANGELAKIPQLIEDFKASGVDVLVTVGYPASRAAKAAGIKTVIAYGSGDPVATGLVSSLAGWSLAFRMMQHCCPPSAYRCFGRYRPIFAKLRCCGTKMISECRCATRRRRRRLGSLA